MHLLNLDAEIEIMKGNISEPLTEYEFQALKIFNEERNKFRKEQQDFEQAKQRQGEHGV